MFIHILIDNLLNEKMKTIKSIIKTAKDNLNTYKKISSFSELRFSAYSMLLGISSIPMAFSIIRPSESVMSVIQKSEAYPEFDILGKLSLISPFAWIVMILAASAGATLLMAAMALSPQKKSFL